MNQFKERERVDHHAGESGSLLPLTGEVLHIPGEIGPVPAAESAGGHRSMVGQAELHNHTLFLPGLLQFEVDRLNRFARLVAAVLEQHPGASRTLPTEIFPSAASWW